MIRIFLLVFLFLCFGGGTPTQARLLLPNQNLGSGLSSKSWGVFLSAGSDTYRIGDEWGKKTTSWEELKRAPESFRRAVLATAKVNRGGTGFYLGKFAGKHLMATNHHVMPKASQCSSASVQFPFLELRYACAEFIGTWTDIDLTLFVISVNRATEEQELAAVAGNFAFQEDVFAGEELLTAGFGIADNWSGNLVVNQDDDCRVFSAKGDYHFMYDPDAINPGEYQAWSFANGCDVSHGDSGSAMVDRRTGKVMGIIWTGKIPKSERVQQSSYLQQLLHNSNDPDIWQELSYAVPAKKIGEHLQKVLTDTSVSERVKEVLRDLLRR